MANQAIGNDSGKAHMFEQTLSVEQTACQDDAGHLLGTADGSNETAASEDPTRPMGKEKEWPARIHWMEWVLVNAKDREKRLSPELHAKIASQLEERWPEISKYDQGWRERVKCRRSPKVSDNDEIDFLRRWVGEKCYLTFRVVEDTLQLPDASRHPEGSESDAHPDLKETIRKRRQLFHEMTQKMFDAIDY